jgi:acetyl-CoA carboxylase beta subunit
LLEHGMLDAIVDRREMRAYLIKLLSFMVNSDIAHETVIDMGSRQRPSLYP